MTGWQIALAVWGGWWALAVACALVLGRVIHQRDTEPRKPAAQHARIPAQRKENQQ